LESDAQLNFNPGVVLKFQDGTGILTKNGTIVAAGRPDRPIVFTSWRDPMYSDETGVRSGDWVGLYFDGVQRDTRLENVEIRYAGGNSRPRGAIALTESSPQFVDLKISNSAWYPVSLDVKSNPQVQAITFENNNPSNAIVVRGSNLDTVGEQVWSPWFDAFDQPLVRVVMNTITIEENATFRIEPGTTIKFESDAALDVHGGLLVDGAVLTSLHDDEYGGDTDGGASGEPIWQGVMIHSRKPNRLSTSTIRFARVGLILDNAATILENSRIEYSRDSALYADLSSELAMEDVQLTNNAINGLQITDEVLAEDETHWGIVGSRENQIPRVFNKVLSVGSSSKLIIEPGVILKFQQEGGLLVEGELQAGAVEHERVYFTSINDDSVGGDTDNLAQTPNRGSWLGVTVNPNNTNPRLSLFNTVIRFATNGLHLSALPVWNYDDLIITDSQLYGISCDEHTFFDPEDDRITLINNGAVTLECPTPDREVGQ
jgi:hypothetical protein